MILFYTSNRRGREKDDDLTATPQLPEDGDGQDLLLLTLFLSWRLANCLRALCPRGFLHLKDGSALGHMR